MKEHPPKPNRDETEREAGTSNTGARKHGPGAKGASKPAWEGRTLEPDLRIDLSAEDALGRLNEVHKELGSAPEAGETETVTPEDERELERDLADPKKMEEDPFFSEFSPRDKETEEAALELLQLVRAGYDEGTLQKIADSLADAIVKKEEGAARPQKKEEIAAYLRRRCELLTKETPLEDDEDGDPTLSA